MMAGKLHTNYTRYSGVGPGIKYAVPGQKLARAYAEGWQAARAGGDFPDNPHVPAVSGNPAYQAWQTGMLDYNSGFPSTHVGGPDGIIPPPPPEEPDPPEGLTRARDGRITKKRARK